MTKGCYMDPQSTDRHLIRYKHRSDYSAMAS